jgi:amidase
MRELDFATARSVAARIRTKEVSPVEVLDHCLARVDALDGPINAVIWRNDDQAREVARRKTEALVRTDPDDLPPFFGVPMPIKDLTPVAGWPVTYGSWGAPAGLSEESALVVEAFERGGFVLTGRTNTPEFGPLTATENLRYGVTRNPWNPDRTPGGSSGGAGAATAAGMFPLAHGNDGGGSIRIPASCCGLVGLKVSRGRIPARYAPWEGGAVEGVLTRDVADTAAVLDLLSGPDAGCWYNAPAPDTPFVEQVGADPGRLRIGLVTSAPLELPVDPDCVEAARAAATALEDCGHTVVEADMALPREAQRAFLQIVNSGFADYEDVDWERTEPHVRAARAAAERIGSLTYVAAVHRLQRITRPFVARWGSAWDLLVTPTLTIPPPEAGSVMSAAHAHAGRTPRVVLQMVAFTSAFNIVGLPAISLPTHTSSSGLPVGIQLVGGPWGELRLLALAAQLEAALPWAGKLPAQ